MMAGGAEKQGALERRGEPDGRRERFLEEVRGGTAPAESLGLVGLLAKVPEEEVWLEGLRAERTRRAYRIDVGDFIASLGISAREELRDVRPAAVIHWKRVLEDKGLKPRTIRRKLSALSSLFGHLVRTGLMEHNPAREVQRPKAPRKGVTAAFSREEAKAILDAPDPETLAGKRDRALLAVGFQVGLRRKEIAGLTVGDLHKDRGVTSLRYVKKGGEEISVGIHPQVESRLVGYLEAAGHGGNPKAPMFLPLRGNQRTMGENPERHLDPDGVLRVLTKYAKEALGVTRGYSAHSMRATYITEALKQGADLKDVQRDVGHADPSTTALYYRGGHDPEQSTSFLVNY